MHPPYTPRTFLLRSWFKGNDTRSLARYVEWKFARILADYDEQGPENQETYLQNIHLGAKHANGFLRCLYSSPLWMTPETARAASDSGLSFLRLFNQLASQALQLGWPRYKLTCKLHMMAHIAHQLRSEAASGHKVLNPLSASCQLDEDMVGRICALARSCAAKTMHQRVLQKYLVNLAVRW